MEKRLSAFLLILFLGCHQSNKQKPIKCDDLYFKAIIAPAFDEHAEVTIYRRGDTGSIQFLLRDAYGNDKPSDTFYFRKADLKQNHFDRIRNELVKEMPNLSSIHNTGIRDGIGFGFTIFQQGDTSQLTFANPQKEKDSAAVEFIKNAVGNFQSFYYDSIIDDYLSDILNYFNNSPSESPLRGYRKIDELRRVKYSR